MSEENSLNDLVKAIEELLRVGNHAAVIAACDRSLENFPCDWRLWNLMGTALGAKGQHDMAAKCFVSVISLAGFQCSTMTNLITANFGNGETALACRTIDKYFERLCYDCKRHVLQSVVEAVRIGDATLADLPKTVLDLIANVETL